MNSEFAVPNVRSVFYESESISYVISPKVLNIAPLDLKELTNVVAFKKGIKEWNSKNVHVGYVRNAYQI